ncbi:MAG TPA: hypothetical protein VFQ20_11755 [Burkholderiaceae bacterium]|nr:hypothetical protein [Burkholderiaceae bacterium]
MQRLVRHRLISLNRRPMSCRDHGVDRTPNARKTMPSSRFEGDQRAPRPLRRKGAAKVIAEGAPSAWPPGADVVEHPDGYYWTGPDGDQEFGPFASREAARADRDRWNEEAPTEGETVQEAEREIGIAEWIDAETGAPAEGQSPPHLEEP